MTVENQQKLDQDYNTYFKEGALAYTKGEYLNSSEFFKKLINLYPDDPDVNINLGNALYKMENFDEAAVYWAKARKIDNYNVKTYINMGNLHFRKSNFEEAIKEWQNGLIIHPTSATILINLASTYEKLGEKKKAFKLYEIFLKSATDKTNADHNKILKKLTIHKIEALNQMKKGIIFQKKQQYRNAVKYYLKSIETYPVFTKGYLNLGNVCYVAEKYGSAIEYWLESYLLDKKQINLCVNMALSYEKLEKYIDSYCFFERFVKKTNKNSPDFINAQHKKKVLKGIISNDPKMLIDYRRESETLLKDNKFEQALVRFENLYIITEDKDVLSEITKIKIELEPLLKAAVYAFEAGKKHKAEGNVDQAIAFFKKCQTLWPEGYYAKQSAEIIAECGKIMGNAITAIMKVTQ
jgi:tetratricopeptide (TPR) repeat protein